MACGLEPSHGSKSKIGLGWPGEKLAVGVPATSLAKKVICLLILCAVTPATGTTLESMTAGELKKEHRKNSSWFLLNVTAAFNLHGRCCHRNTLKNTWTLEICCLRKNLIFWMNNMLYCLNSWICLNRLKQCVSQLCSSDTAHFGCLQIWQTQFRPWWRNPLPWETAIYNLWNTKYFSVAPLYLIRNVTLNKKKKVKRFLCGNIHSLNPVYCSLTTR